MSTGNIDKNISGAYSLIDFKLYEDIIANREDILRAFIAETGLRPSEVEQVWEPNIMSWSVRKKKDD